MSQGISGKFLIKGCITSKKNEKFHVEKPLDKRNYELVFVTLRE